MTRAKGFSIVEVVIVIAIVGLIGLIGWRIWDAQHHTQAGTDQPETSQQSQVPDINTESDLDKASNALDAADVEGSESQRLDAETSF